MMPFFKRALALVLMMTLMTLPNIYMLWRLRHKLQKETQINLHKVV